MTARSNPLMAKNQAAHTSSEPFDVYAWVRYRNEMIAISKRAGEIEWTVVGDVARLDWTEREREAQRERDYRREERAAKENALIRADMENKL